MAHTQDQIMLTLSYLRGERTVPTTNYQGRQEFIQQTLAELYTAYPWRFSEVNTALTLASGVATLPSGLCIEHGVNLSYMDGDNEIPYEEIDLADRSKAQSGDHSFWITSLGDDNYLLNTKDTADPLLLTYHTIAPEISATVATAYPDRLTIALGANRFVKLSEDPDADLAQDDALFTNRRNANMAAQNMGKAKRVRRSAQSETGSYTGEI